MPKHRETRSFRMKSHFLGRRFHIIPSREPAVFGSHRVVLYHMRRRVSIGQGNLNESSAALSMEVPELLRSGLRSAPVGA